MRENGSVGSSRSEFLILVATLGLVAACAASPATGARAAAWSVGDAANLRRHYEWLHVHRLKHNAALPDAGGHKFVLATWTSRVFEHTPENFDRFWTPGPTREQDPSYQELRKLVASGEEPWPSLESVTSLDTHYVGRARAHLRTAEDSANEAWMANDNEGHWSLPDGSVNVLFANGAVRSYPQADLRGLFGVGAFDPNAPVVTWGPDSPIPPCRKLDN